MIPNTLATFAAFLMLVAPGLVFEIRRERRRPALQETAFREASRVAFTSLLFSGLALVLLSAIRGWWPALLLDPGAWLRQGKIYLVSNYRIVARTGLVQVAVAVGLALLVDELLAQSQTKGHITPFSAWYHVFRKELPPNQVAWVGLRLSDKTEIWGYLKHYGAESDVKNREITLRADVDGRHLYMQAEGDEQPKELTDWKTIVVPGDQIVLLKVTYKDQAFPEGL